MTRHEMGVVGSQGHLTHGVRRFQGLKNARIFGIYNEHVIGVGRPDKKDIFGFLYTAI